MENNFGKTCNKIAFILSWIMWFLLLGLWLWSDFIDEISTKDLIMICMMILLGIINNEKLNG
jgi:hypothetical protein